ncbi:MAG TPA: hypothetical protein VL463_35410 [Kofleriaceae bacterium]|nr:hypothetical protein [Kofleriaceae bacterium]
MNYVHCTACGRAYDAAKRRRCPTCVSGVEDEVADAAAQLARALARASPDELDALVARIGETIPAPAPRPSAEGSGPHVLPSADQWAAVVLGAVGGAVAEERGTALATIETPKPPAAPATPPSVRAMVTALVTAVAVPARAAIRRRASAFAARARAMMRA